MRLDEVGEGLDVIRADQGALSAPVGTWLHLAGLAMEADDAIHAGFADAEARRQSRKGPFTCKICLEDSGAKVEGERDRQYILALSVLTRRPGCGGIPGHETIRHRSRPSRHCLAGPVEVPPPLPLRPQGSTAGAHASAP